MRIEIRNYRGIERATIDCEPIALVCGRNGAGKTSIAEAVAAALTGRANIVPGVTKAGADVLMRDGAKRGSCEIEHGGWSWAVYWPGCTVRQTSAATLSPYAVGIASLADLPPKDVAAELVRILGADPTEDETLAALAGAGVPAAMARAVWGFIASEGWDAAHARATSRATEAKGAWGAVTGERWGPTKAAGWRHPSTVDADAETMATDMAEKAAELERVIAARAVGAAQIERWREIEAAGVEAQASLPDAERRAAEAKRAHQAAHDELMALPAPAADPVPCPHCAGPLRVDRGGIVAAEHVSVEENAKRERYKARAREQCERLMGEANTADMLVQKLVARVAAGRDAAHQIAEARTDGASEDDVAAARAALSAARAAAGAHEANAKAAAEHARVTGFLAAAEVLAPAGIRQTVARRAMGELVVSMGGLAALAGWQPVTVGEDGVTRYGGRAYGLLSRSEQFRARVLLQLAIAQRQAAPLVVIDAADILDREGRNGLFRILRQLAGELRALVTMTVNGPGDAPNLGAAGIGRTYWIEGWQTE